MEDLVQLAYVSRREPSLTNREIIDAIVIPGMRRNRALNITGCLWFGDERFLQVLEGDPKEVEGLYDRIRRDKRHFDVQLVSFAPVQQRSFDRFSLKHIESAELVEVDALIARFSPKPREPGPQAKTAPDTVSLLQAVILRLRSFVL